ncbi:MAG: hypothetical protein WD845_12825 [Pirellulales bacterium]
MSFKRPVTAAQIEPLVRDYLEAEGRAVDAARLHAEIRRRGPGAALPPDEDFLSAPGSRLGWRLMAAACLAFILGLGGYLALSPDQASAYALVRAAESKLGNNVDRCYRIETQVPKIWLRTSLFLHSGDETVLWTRGDRFQVTTTEGERRLVWGQDDQRRLWIVGEPQRGLQFERGEGPNTFARTRAYLGLDVRRLARRFLEQFDLQIENRKSGESGDVVFVQAKAKSLSRSQPFNSARVEIELKTKLIRKLELTRVVDGDVKAQFTFTLIDERPLPLESYRLESQLADGAEVLDARRAVERDEALRQLMAEWR